MQPCWIHLLEVRMCEVAQNPLGITRERKRPGFQWALHQLFEFVVPVAAVICLSVHYVFPRSAKYVQRHVGMSAGFYMVVSPKSHSRWVGM
jgi:hypothetical protein